MADFPFSYIVPFSEQGGLPAQLSKLPSPVRAIMMRHLPPSRITPLVSLTSPLSRAKGWIITANLPCLDLTPERSTAILFNKTFKACRLAARKGARIAGLGFDYLNAGDIGAAVARNLPMAVTSGLSYSLAASLEGSLHALEQIRLDLEQAEVVVLGASGNAGGIMAQLLAREGVNYLTLIERDKHRLENLARRIMHESGVPCKITIQARKAVSRADLLIAAPAGTIEKLSPGDLKPGAIVCVLGRPYPFFVEAARTRADVLFFDGGLVKLTDHQANFSVGNFPPGVFPPGLAEVVILTLEGRFENYSLGAALRVGKVEEIRRLGHRHGFYSAGWQYRGRIVSMIPKCDRVKKTS